MACSRKTVYFTTLQIEDCIELDRSRDVPIFLSAFRVRIEGATKVLCFAFCVVFGHRK